MEHTDVRLAADTSDVTRRGDVVIRTTGSWSAAVHVLLQNFENAGFEGAPRFLGIDDAGREILTYVEGDVFRHATPEIMTEAALAELGRLLRRMHDAAADFSLPDGVSWGHPLETAVRGKPVVCHNDISPKNVVFREGLPIAFIDWDMAAPAPAVWDLAHCAWQFVPLVADAGWIASGWPEPPPLPIHLRRVRELVDGYGLDRTSRVGFGAIVALRMERTLTGIDALADAGEPAFIRFRDEGVVAEIAVARGWVLRHVNEIDAALLE